MSMKACADEVKTILEAITSPSVPVVYKVPSQQGDWIPSKAKPVFWINVEPNAQERTDEANRSTLRGYGFIANCWYSIKSAKKRNTSIEDAADMQMDICDAVLDKLGHNNLGGWARYGIAYDDIETTQFEGGDDDDTVYVVRIPFIVWRQEA